MMNDYDLTNLVIALCLIGLWICVSIIWIITGVLK